MTPLPNKHYRGYSQVTDEESDHRTSEKYTWRKKCGQQVSAGGRWR